MGRRLQTVAAIGCMKLLLMIFNTILCVTGVTIFAFGLWMKISLHNLLELSDEYSEVVPYVFIGTGLIITLVGMFACCCTVKGQPVLLYILSILLGIIFLFEISLGVTGYVYRGKIQSGFESGLKSAISHYGEGGIRDYDIDILQSYLKCCGVKSYMDWNAEWKNDSVPLSCCRDKNHCHNAPVTNTSEIYTSGCYVNVVDFVNHNLGAIGGGAVGVACLQFLGMLLAFCLAKHVDKAKYEPVA